MSEKEQLSDEKRRVEEQLLLSESKLKVYSGAGAAKASADELQMYKVSLAVSLCAEAPQVQRVRPEPEGHCPSKVHARFLQTLHRYQTGDPPAQMPKLRRCICSQRRSDNLFVVSF